jgi:hypothetical protein
VFSSIKITKLINPIFKEILIIFLFILKNIIGKKIIIRFIILSNLKKKLTSSAYEDIEIIPIKPNS